MFVNRDKKMLRSQLLADRKHNIEKDNTIFNIIISLYEFISAELVLTYVSMPDEIDTRQLIDYCFKNNKTVAVPRVVEKNIEFKIINGFDDLEVGFFNVSEPKEFCPTVYKTAKSFCVVPALACNKQNYRIGYGKGFYDRFLSRYDGFSAALCYSENIINLPINTYDFPTDLVITEC